MKFTPYTTTVGSAYKLDKLTNALQVAAVSGNLVSNIYPGYTNIRAVVDNDKHSIIPLFYHPLSIKTPSGESMMVIDLRPWASKVSNQEGAISIPKKSAAELVVKRACVSYLWENGNAEDLFNISPLPITVYSRWITGAISKRLGLSPADQVVVQIFSAIFYISQFTDLKQWDAGQSTDVCVLVAGATGIPVETVLQYAQDIDPIADLASFVTALKATNQTKNFTQLSPALVLTLVAGSWYGLADNREVIGVAIEHPPTFVALIDAAINNATFKRTPLSDIVHGLNKKDNFSRFTLSFSGFIHRGSQGE